eukprot:TRINITY_DN3650_c0_g2_i1.p1 TRINITY_DN3650_c0_g2~~TRINITY_DN3650_c0_g2_i1.p1  ORF type:complete len:477 (-),score=49.01 TRINITY_DN3650_c0_g2_i1:174-1604(-)
MHQLVQSFMRRVCPYTSWWHSLRFSSDEREASFMQSRKAALFRGMTICLSGVTFFLFLIIILSMRDFSTSLSPILKEFTRVHLFIMLGEIVFLILGILVVWKTRSHAFILEKCVVVLLLMIVVLILVNDRWYAAVALGYPTYGLYSDARVLLALDTLITVSHLTLPIRWCMLLPVNVLTPVAYLTFAICFDSPDGQANVIYNVLILTFLTFMSSIGKRTAEMFERKAFADVISEKSLRFEAEHKLSLSATKDVREVDRGRPQSVGASSATFDLSSCSALVTPSMKQYEDKGTQVGFPLQRSTRPPVLPDQPKDERDRPMPAVVASLVARQQRKSRNRERSHSAPVRSRESSGGRQRCVVQTTGSPTLKHFERTSVQASELACEKALLHLNVCGTGCCPYHLGLEALMSVIQRRNLSKCDNTFEPHDGWQCNSCKAMNDVAENETDDVYCDICWQKKSCAASAHSASLQNPSSLQSL